MDNQKEEIENTKQKNISNNSRIEFGVFLSMSKHQYFNWRHNRVSTPSKEPLAEKNNEQHPETEENGQV